jgi:hypothetical protein
MHDHPEFLRNVAAQDEPLEEPFVPRRYRQDQIINSAVKRFSGYGTNRRAAL